MSVEIGSGESTRPARNNNPGNLKFKNQPGAGLEDAAPDGKRQFARFGSPEAGMAALERQIRAYQSGRTDTGVRPDSTIREMMAIYTPEGDFETHLNNVIYALRDYNAKAETRINRLPTEAIADAVAWAESNTIVRREEP